MSTPEAPAAFRRHFAAHNRQVILIAAASAFFSVVAWALLYFIAYWLLLLGGTAATGAEAPLPEFLLVPFVISSVILVLGVALVRRLSPVRRLCDNKRWWEHAADLLLAIPRATVTAWETLRAYQFLDARELAVAWELLRWIREKRRLPVWEVPQVIPDERTRDRILVALQLTQLIHVQSISGDICLLPTEAAAPLCDRPVRIRLPR